MKRNQLLLLIILVLVATNLYLLWYVNNSQPTEEPKLTRNERLKNWVQRDLGFDSAQAEQYIALRNQRDSLLKPVNAELRDAKMRMIALKSNPEASDSLVQSVVQNIAAKQAAVELVYLAHFRRLNALCLPDQRPRLDSLLERVIKRNTGGGADSTLPRMN